MKMTVSYEWLCDLVPNLDQYSPEDVGLALTAVGAETEEISILSYGKEAELAEVINIKALAKNSVVTIKTSSKTYKTISNSKNLTVGDYVIASIVGGLTFGDKKIESREIEGIKTTALLLALENLGIETKSNDIAILGKDLSKAQEYFEVYTSLDAIYTLDVPGNRADWLSVRGLARALSIYFNLEFKKIPHFNNTISTIDKDIVIQSNRCTRYALKKISGITNDLSSALYQKRLLLLGMRPINYIVDLTNIAMLETGQPTHAFDARTIKGNIIIRQAKKDETLILLDEKEISLSEDDLLICDEEKILALAGIMGGLHSGVSRDTTEIYLESASFNNVWVRRSAKRLGIKTESSLRFEKNITSELVPYANDFICSTFEKDFLQVQISENKDLYPKPTPKYTISCTPDDVRKYLGLYEIDDAFIADIITKIGCQLETKSHHWTIHPSGERGDLRIKEDIIEEVARFYGYDKIPATVYRPSGIFIDPNKSFDEKIRPLLRGMGLHEAVTVVFRSKETRKFHNIEHPHAVTIANPLNIEWTELRTHLFDGLLHIVKHNSDKAFERNIAFSEIANVFHKNPSTETFIEEKKLCFIVSNDNNPYEKALNILNNILVYAKVKNTAAKHINTEKYPFLHPLNAFKIMLGEKSLGFFGEIHPELAEKYDLSDKKEFPSPTVCEIDFDTLKAHFEEKSPVQPINELPPMLRDITLCVPESEFGINIQQKLQDKNPNLKEISFISVFQNEKLKKLGKKNLSLRLRFESIDPLNSEEIDYFIHSLLSEYK
ncbi:MAG: phenylalanine--tRNA ligase subunit beta [Brevinema sp.]